MFLSLAPFRAFLLSIACLVLIEAQAQLDQSFKPLPVYDGKDLWLVKSLKQQLKEELYYLEPKIEGMSRRYESNTGHLIRMVKGGRIIEDKTLQKFVDDIFHDLVEHSKLRVTPKRVLIAKLPEVNAMCVGEGTFVVTTGLLGRINNESQLAFTLAHEIAHYELGHVRERIRKEASEKISKKVKKGLVNVLKTDVEKSDLDTLRNMMYQLSHFERKHERAADSLGLIILQRAGFNTRESIGLLSILDSVDYTKKKLGYALFNPFQFAKYPFQEHWLDARPSMYTKRPAYVAIFAIDSIKTHPEISKRIEWLGASLVDNHLGLNKRPDEEVQQLIAQCQFEDLDLQVEFHRLDYALLMALQLKADYPANQYLVSTIAKILIDLSEDKDVYQDRKRDLPDFIGGYGDELKFVNTFLHNLKEDEMLEIAFNFLNSQGNFNADNPEHYYLLWRVCELTNRKTVQLRVEKSFEERFGKEGHFDREEYRKYYIDIMKTFLRPGG
ncbi:Putative Zn-dependent protease, contains TPR repeats [Chryseolinea serpens]|uniref:Putative Zn-dependent protease, contains TPR repeats n=2 Tax=Chryseolinea serpens TaxID=947013 RepID=A0A1M5KAF4_9BACT|nr:Putative Zn-dependent protease, contains TPR repeats [Chryseolinea serpens]